jgi:hypothetical protein
MKHEADIRILNKICFPCAESLREDNNCSVRHNSGEGTSQFCQCSETKLQVLIGRTASLDVVSESQLFPWCGQRLHMTNGGKVNQAKAFGAGWGIVMPVPKISATCVSSRCLSCDTVPCFQTLFFICSCIYKIERNPVRNVLTTDDRSLKEQKWCLR